MKRGAGDRGMAEVSVNDPELDDWNDSPDDGEDDENVCIHGIPMECVCWKCDEEPEW